MTLKTLKTLSFKSRFKIAGSYGAVKPSVLKVPPSSMVSSVVFICFDSRMALSVWPLAEQCLAVLVPM